MRVIFVGFFVCASIVACWGQEGAPVQKLSEIYERGEFEVARTWTEIKAGNHRTSVFIHVPVVSAAVELIPVLPTGSWQQSHAAHLERKVGNGHNRALAGKSFYAARKGFTQATTPFPVLIFGAGYTWLPTDYYELLLPLVRRGVIVVTVAAAPVSKVIGFPDGTVLDTEPKLDYDTQAEILAAVTARILAMGEAPDNLLYKQVDRNRIVAGGHSLSGAAAIAAAAKERLITAIINLDGDVTETIATLTPVQPILYITTQPPQIPDSNPVNWADDRSETRRDTYFKTNASRSRNAIRLKIPGMFHLDFLDVAHLKNQLPERLRTNRFGMADPAVARKLIIESMYTFIREPMSAELSWSAVKKINPQVLFIFSPTGNK